MINKFLITDTVVEKVDKGWTENFCVKEVVVGCGRGVYYWK